MKKLTLELPKVIVKKVLTVAVSSHSLYYRVNSYTTKEIFNTEDLFDFDKNGNKSEIKSSDANGELKKKCFTTTKIKVSLSEQKRMILMKLIPKLSNYIGSAEKV